MVDIYKNGTMLRVSRGAYRSIYKPQGWIHTDHPKEVEDEITQPDPEIPTQDEFEQEVDEDTEDEEEYDEESESEPNEIALSEIPLSDMSLQQLKAYGEELGLDISDINTKKEARKAIREHIRDN